MSNKTDYDFLVTLMTKKSTDLSVEPFARLFGKKILIYGAGSFGREMFSALKKERIDVSAFLDKKAEFGQKIDGIGVFQPDTLIISPNIRSNFLVILSIVLIESERKEIISYLNSLGYHTIIDAQTLRAMKVPFDPVHDEPVQDLLLQEKSGIVNAYSLLRDSHSQDIFNSSLQSHCERNYNYSLESVGTIQYFSPDLPSELRFTRFVDCGAYRGDTLESLLSYADIEIYAGFEPGKKSFFLLSETADKLCESIPCYLYPCAVGERTTIVSFCDIPGSGAVNGFGEEIIPMVRLDDVLKNFRSTMIKMDIEGQEYNALLGARNMITRYKPDLAICVYHYISDIWRIPNLIHSWNLGYQFYLRAHSSATMETVLYAIVREED